MILGVLQGRYVSMKNKILFCDSPLPSPGGGQLSLLAILENIDRDKYEPLVFIPYECEFAEWLRTRGIPVFVVPHTRLYHETKRTRPDLIHCNAATIKYTFLAALVARILNIPFLWHVRVVESGGWRDRVIAPFCKRVIVISDAVGQKFSWLKGKDKLVKIHNALNPEHFRPSLDDEGLRRELGIGAEQKVVGIFSRLSPEKGHWIFLDAARTIREGRSDVKFLIVGGGDSFYSEQLRKYADRFNLEKYVIWTGFRTDIPQLMNLCDIIVSPSIKGEGFGRTIIEAMACGVPIIATAIGGQKKIISHNHDGVLVQLEGNFIAEEMLA